MTADAPELSCSHADRSRAASHQAASLFTKDLEWRRLAPAGDSQRDALLAVRLPLRAEVQDVRLGILSGRPAQSGKVTSLFCSQPTRARTRSLGAEGRTRKACLCCDDVGVGGSPGANVGYCPSKPRERSYRDFADLRPLLGKHTSAEMMRD